MFRSSFVLMLYGPMVAASVRIFIAAIIALPMQSDGVKYSNTTLLKIVPMSAPSCGEALTRLCPNRDEKIPDSADTPDGVTVQEGAGSAAPHNFPSALN